MEYPVACSIIAVWSQRHMSLSMSAATVVVTLDRGRWESVHYKPSLPFFAAAPFT